MHFGSKVEFCVLINIGYGANQYVAKMAAFLRWPPYSHIINNFHAHVHGVTMNIKFVAYLSCTTSPKNLFY